MARLGIGLIATALVRSALATQWIGAMETPMGLMADAGISPKPTAAPGFDGIPKELRRRQSNPYAFPPPDNWCGFVSGLYGETAVPTDGRCLAHNIHSRSFVVQRRPDVYLLRSGAGLLYSHDRNVHEYIHILCRLRRFLRLGLPGGRCHSEMVSRLPAEIAPDMSADSFPLPAVLRCVIAGPFPSSAALIYITVSRLGHWRRASSFSTISISELLAAHSLRTLSPP